MLAALLFACNCLGHDPLFSTPAIAQDSSAIYAQYATLNRVDKFTGERKVLTAPAGNVRAVDVDGALLYYGEERSLKMISVFGGEPQELAAGDGIIVAIHHDGEAIYWVERAPGNIRRMNRQTRVVETLLSATTITENNVAFDEESIYTTAIGGGLWRIDKSSGEQTWIGPEPVDPAARLTTDGTNVYFETSFAARHGSTLTPIPSPLGPIAAVAGGRVYYATLQRWGGNWLQKLDAADLCTGASTPLLSTGTYSLDQFAVDSCGVYSRTGLVACLAAPLYITSITPGEASAAGGTTVTIDGHGFDADARVSIGASDATIVSITSTRINAITSPAAAGTALLTVHSGGNCTAEPFTVISQPRHRSVRH